jgi:hypothetical protein
MVSSQTLRKRLHEQKHIAETETSRETIIVRKTINGKRTRVFSIHRASLFSEPGQPDQPDQSRELGESPLESSPIGQVLPDQWSGSESTPDQDDPLNNNGIPFYGQVGQVKNETESKNTNLSRVYPFSGQVDSENLTNAPEKPDQSEKTLDLSTDEEVF